MSPRLGGLVDYSDPHAPMREPKGQNEAGGSGPDDEHIGVSVRRSTHNSC